MFREAVRECPFYQNLRYTQKKYPRNINQMSVYPVKCLPSEMRSPFHNGTAYLTGAIIFSVCLDFEKIAILGQHPSLKTKKQIYQSHDVEHELGKKIKQKILIFRQCKQACQKPNCRFWVGSSPCINLLSRGL